MEKPRFSMLLLEPGEIYFEDFSCTMNNTSPLPTKADTGTGRLKLCSKSLVFEPRNWDLPLIKIHFKDCIQIAVVKSSSAGEPQNIIQVKSSQYAEMMKENILAPYQFIYETKEFFFALDFASAEECLSQMQQLQRASTLHAPEHNSMIATILHSRYMRMVFDTVMMDDYTEQIVCELLAEKISPLVKHQGKLALTPTTLYFQPFNNIESSPILKLKLSDIRRMYKRRFLLRHVGIELYSDDSSSVPHLYLSLQTEKARDHLYNILEQSPNIKLERVHAEEMTLQWQNGVVSNYDYLVFLNCQADRSKNDLTQYPVFPWVVADYKSETLDLEDAATFRDLSKPMGALNPERLERIMERYHEMSDPKFMYGSHYSAPGLVLFYLVRKHPQLMLCLQNGRFDHPDRMFNSVADVYNNCLRNMSDFKELLPEFYDTNSKGDFLVNNFEIDFGERHDGTKVNDVKLPPWATSPEDFVRKLRDALESDFVSRHLHLWIDLIFGYKQRGVEAVNAFNVFYHLCYEGAVDLELVLDMNDRHALEVQIMEFGQVPRQLFFRPHARRAARAPPRPPPAPVKCERDTIQLHREAVTCAIIQGNKVISVGKDGTLKVYDATLKKQIRSVSLCSTPLSACVAVERGLVAAASWSNDIYLYDVEYGRVVESFRAHDDSVSCLLWLEQEQVLVSGGWDGVARAWARAGGAAPALRGLRAELDHDGRVTALSYRCKNKQVDLITGTDDGEVFVWSLTTKELLNKISVHSSPVSGLCVAMFEDRVVTTAEDGSMCVTDLSVSHPVYSKQLKEPVTSLYWDAEATLWLGCADGTLMQWNMITVTVVSEERVHDDSVLSVNLDKATQTLVTASKDKSVKLWSLTS